MRSKNRLRNSVFHFIRLLWTFSLLHHTFTWLRTGCHLGLYCFETLHQYYKGAVFDHKAETAGLGAEITQKWFMDCFKDEKVAIPLVNWSELMFPKPTMTQRISIKMITKSMPFLVQQSLVMELLI